MSQQRSDVHAATDSIEHVGETAPDYPQAAGPEAPATVARAAAPHELKPVPLPKSSAERPAASPANDKPESGDASAALLARVGKLERQNRRMRAVLTLVALVVGYFSYVELFPEGVIVQKTLLESEEVKLLDQAGNPRLFLRMYSRVPVLQIMDGNGKPRMSLGLRFDDTPFIDLSDKTGNTRATFEMTENDEPTLRLFDRNGETTFKIN